MTEEDKGQGQDDNTSDANGSESTDETPTVESLTADLENAQKIIQNLRRFERKAKKLEKQLAEQSPEGGDDSGNQTTPPDTTSQPSPADEKLRKQLAEAQAREARLMQERTEALIKSAVVAEASKAGFEHPEDAWGAIDLSEIDHDDDTGETHGVAEQVEALAKARPRWLKSAGVGVGAGAGGRQMTDEQLRAEIFGGRRADAFWKGGGVFQNEE